MRDFLKHYRPFFLYAGFFSLFINLLLLAPALYMLQVFDRVLTSRHEETLVLLTVLTVGALVMMMFLEMLRSRLLAGAAVAMDRRLGPQVLARLLDGARQPGGIDNVHGLKDLGTLRSFLTGPGILSLFDAPWLPIYILVIFLFHPLMGAVACVGAVTLFILALLNEKLTRKPLEELQTQGRCAGRFVDLSLRNAEAVNAMGMVGGVTEAWQGTNRKVLELQLTSSQWAARISAATKFMRQLVQVSMLGTGAWLVIGLDVSPGVMIAATILLGRALAPVEILISGWRSLVDARSAANRLRELLPDQAEAPQATALPAPRGSLSLDKVVFSIRGRERPILKGVSWELPAGESLAILGPSASGKSTLVRLVVGVWKPVSGVVRLDGADVAVWPREQLGPHVGYLPQDVELFAGTVSENINRLGAPDSEGVIEAAQRANAHELILQLPQGYDTQIGEGGAVLSGGQRQRIALARALYGQPRLVVLDEPNASLDAEGEEALMHTMRQLKQEGVTLVVITHRPALVVGMGKVLVLKEGNVEYFGPKQEFLAKVTRSSRAFDASAPVTNNQRREAG
jgi:PrtD family type I secretion system ABC transporter